MEQQYKIQNYITGTSELYITEAKAVARITELTAQIMEMQAARFNIIYIEKFAEGENWGNVSDASPENGIYRVFISETGLHEEFQKKSEALAKNQELKDAFLASLAQVPVLADPLKQPSSTGTQTL